MLAAAAAVSLFVLLEAFDRTDVDRGARFLERSLAVSLLGVNARDLATLAVDSGRHAALAEDAPGGIPLVAERGIVTPAQAADVARFGYGAALVGESLMRASDPASLLSAMIRAGRLARAREGVSR